MKQIITKKHRLLLHEYGGKKKVAFTVVEKERRKMFVTENMFVQMENILKQVMRERKCWGRIYMFMPDHAHLIIEGCDEESNVKKCMDLFKQKSGYWLSQNKIAFRWQHDYYDHIIRSQDELRRQIKYVLNNPVHGGIVDSWHEYRYWGTEVLARERIMEMLRRYGEKFVVDFMTDFKFTGG